MSYNSVAIVDHSAGNETIRNFRIFVSVLVTATFWNYVLQRQGLLHTAV